MDYPTCIGINNNKCYKSRGKECSKKHFTGNHKNTNSRFNNKSDRFNGDSSRYRGFKQCYKCGNSMHRGPCPSSNKTQRIYPKSSAKYEMNALIQQKSRWHKKQCHSTDSFSNSCKNKRCCQWYWFGLCADHIKKGNGNENDDNDRRVKVSPN